MTISTNLSPCFCKSYELNHPNSFDEWKREIYYQCIRTLCASASAVASPRPAFAPFFCVDDITKKLPIQNSLSNTVITKVFPLRSISNAFGSQDFACCSENSFDISFFFFSISKNKHKPLNEMHSLYMIDMHQASRWLTSKPAFCAFNNFRVHLSVVVLAIIMSGHKDAAPHSKAKMRAESSGGKKKTHAEKQYVWNLFSFDGILLFVSLFVWKNSLFFLIYL